MDTGIATAPDDFSRIILKAQAARDYFLLIGPPGTGKTSRALRGMVEAFYREGKQILLLSYTNRAVDEISKALASIEPEIDFIRLGSELSCDDSFRPYLIENVLESCATRRQVQERIARCRVFVGTVATLSSKTELFRLKTFLLISFQLLPMMTAYPNFGTTTAGITLYPQSRRRGCHRQIYFDR